METKLTLDPNIILKAFKSLGSDDFVLVMLAAAYYVKHHNRLPNNFTSDNHQEAFSYFSKHIQPVIDGKPDMETTLNDDEKNELFNLIDTSVFFDPDERKLLKDMLSLWWGRKTFARTEMIYTQSMCTNRTGVSPEKFCELRKWLKAEDCLNWENKPYGDYLTSFHTFNEIKLLELLRENAKEPATIST